MIKKKKKKNDISSNSEEKNPPGNSRLDNRVFNDKGKHEVGIIISMNEQETCFNKFNYTFFCEALNITKIK